MTKGSTTLPLKEGDEGNEMEHECSEIEVNEVREMDEEMNEESDDITSSNITSPFCCYIYFLPFTPPRPFS